jgi:hypothetical protein
MGIYPDRKTIFLLPLFASTLMSHIPLISPCYNQIVDENIECPSDITGLMVLNKMKLPIINGVMDRVPIQTTQKV